MGDKEREAKFLDALAAICNEHGFTIVSCECCGGWDVDDLEEK